MKAKILLRSKLLPHQLECFKQSRLMPGHGNLSEMGTGKTIITLANFAFLVNQGQVSRMLVIAPKGMYHVWGEEMEKHYTAKSWAGIDAYMYGSASAKVEKTTMAAFMEPSLRPRVLIVNVEALSASPALHAWLQKWLKNRRLGETLFVVDEASTIKNPKAKRTRRVIALSGYCEYRRILTGTVMSNSPLDVFGPMSVVDQRILGTSYYAFRSRYTVLKSIRVAGGREVTVVDGYRNLEDLRNRLRPFTYRMTLRELVDIPERYRRVPVELGPTQRRLYNEMVKDAVAVLDSGEAVTAPLALTQLLRLRQILAGYLPHPDGPEHPPLRIEDNRRLDTLLQVIEGIGDAKIVIWTDFQAAVADIGDALAKRYGPKSVITYSPVPEGRTSYGPAGRTEMVKEFQDGAAQFFLSTQATGKYGLTLTSANHTIFYTNDWSLDARAQSEARIFRKGQKNPVLYTDLVAPGTVDDRVRDALLSKQRLATFMNGDKWRQWIADCAE